MIAAIIIMMRSKSSFKAYLIQVAILLIAVVQLSSIEAFATGDACREMFLENSHQQVTLSAEQAKLAAQRYNSIFIEQVSPAYELAWNKYLHYYVTFLLES
ncbi:MAG: hypothetical protein IPM97_02500 [Bdellovibrionaceae bacterium]|nr:hypothetical protein [Pseudobdellovibrionaceae bacterium]